MAYVGKNISVAGFGAKGDFVMGDAHITNLIWRKQPAIDRDAHALGLTSSHLLVLKRVSVD